ncbi:MAG: hypothetical protein CVT48_05635 [Thermoplasmata archaeon HGW-Thermoplasmata-1]|nr:MAG: hypothetical protein CVT48_05635 [Thermoplasmata archaeon HGW-Thermoplasmata-1]
MSLEEWWGELGRWRQGLLIFVVAWLILTIVFSIGTLKEITLFDIPLYLIAVILAVFFSLAIGIHIAARKLKDTSIFDGK